jgi:hypothetical protein
VIFREHFEVKKHLWGGEFWVDGYFVRTVGDEVTAEVIRKYIGYHRNREVTPQQIDFLMFLMPRPVNGIIYSGNVSGSNQS